MVRCLTGIAWTGSTARPNKLLKMPIASKPFGNHCSAKRPAARRDILQCPRATSALPVCARGRPSAVRSTVIEIHEAKSIVLRCSLFGEVSVHGGPGDAQHLRDVSRVDALLPQAARLTRSGVIHLAGTTALTSIGGSRSKSSPGALDHGVPLKLREGGHDGEHRLSHRSFGVQALGETPESRPTSRRCSRS